ncbi:hypothetical protein CVT24_001061 [Panaeolus cyanescens]|uniref:Xylanolytic transcriptional activator regulatory domain-containing protein n=1 Tax=Panaeolus cyanescens TaxID=181874 RepID=A0A409VWY2_9AGAR|nr:hypothetical protein CVT24_001061 [Panaeolus cyanescens]
MPRSTQQTHPRSTTTNNPLMSASVLKRNQACHQCRRRKLSRNGWSSLHRTLVLYQSLNSDAKRPCSTCVRSHEFVKNRAPPGTEMPSEPECTFDDVAEITATALDGPRSRYERLENRINELETLLRQKEGSTSPDRYPISLQNGGLGDIPSGISGSQSSISHSPSQSVHPASPSEGGLQVMWPNWPSSLPNPDLLRHLVDVFFLFHPHANKLFHMPTFMNSLVLPPSHPKFPALPVLHAICAVGSLYTAAVTSPPLPDFNEVAPDEIFLEKYRSKERRPDSFAETHANLSREHSERLTALGEDLFQVLQANIILTWFYWSHGRWVDLVPRKIFMRSAHCMRLSVPLGLNMCPPFHSITKSERPPSILLPARTVIEDETRRNTFWLAYALERQHGSGNGWALSLDDQDVSQLLPLRGDQFLNGTLVSAVDRQWAQSPDLLLTHPEQQVDSFILYIKGTIMLSKVKAFNLRFRSKHFAGDTAVSNLYQEVPRASADPIDPRGSAAFIELDHIVSSFRASFPTHLKNPINNNIVDKHLYTTCLMPLVATVILHDPHAEVAQSGCISALKILTAGRAILDMIYSVWATTYDISLLDTFCSFCWFVGGRVLVRFLQAALDARSIEQVSTLRAEIEFVHSAISKVGERIPLACRYAKMLEDLTNKHCSSIAGVPGVQISFPRPLEPNVLQALFEEHISQPDNHISLHESLHEPGSFLSLA